MFREGDVAVGVDVLGIVQSQFHHGGNHVFQTVAADEGAAFRHLLDGEESGVHVSLVFRFVLFFDDGEQLAFRFFQRDVFFFLDDALKLVERVDGDDVPAHREGFFDFVEAVDIGVELGFDEEDVQLGEFGVALDVDGQVYFVHLGADEKNVYGGLQLLDVGYHVEDDGGLAHARVADNHVVYPFGESLVAAKKLVEDGPRPVIDKQVLVEPHVFHFHNSFHSSCVILFSTK